MKLTLFQDDFYSTKPSRKAMGRKQGIHPKVMLPIAVLILLLGIILTIMMVIGGTKNNPANTNVKEVAAWKDSEQGMYDQRGNGGSRGSHGDDANASHPSSSSANGHAGEGEDSRAVAGEWDVNGPYRSDIAQATARVYDAVVSIVMPADEVTADWQDVYSIGSGIIFRVERNQAYVVTNHHVVAASDELEIVLSNGVKKSAEVIGSDAISDLAILKTDAEGITKVAEFGNSTDLQIGEKAIAIGNPLGLGYAHTTTQGIISSTQRSIPVSLSGNGSLDWEMEVIQTDAAINSGNSGGALVNIHGQVIGINTMKIAWFGVEGLGFAIPIDLAVPVIEELMDKGRVSRPYIGIGAINLYDYFGEEPLNVPDDLKTGAVILTVTGPAERAGLKEYDVIVQLDETKVKNMIEVRKYLYTQKSIGDPIDVTVIRDGRERTFSFELGELPE